MSGKSPIEWTDSTWNPIVGCSIVSPGCTNCYAMKMAARIIAMAGTRDVGVHYDRTIKDVKGKPVWTGVIKQAPEHILLEPLRRKKPTTYFVNSMGDLFHEDCPDEWIDKVFAVMRAAHWHTYQILTKRADRLRRYMTIADDEKLGLPKGEGERRDNICVEAFNLQDTTTDKNGNYTILEEDCYLNEGFWPLPNVWLGVSTERQQEADERIPLLLQTPAAVRFISAEPLIAPIDLTSLDCGGGIQWNALGRTKGGEIGCLDWAIVGGESGPGARPMHPQWARDIRNQCAAAGVPFFFKQWGEHVHATQCDLNSKDPWTEVWIDDATVVARVGKKKAGRLLDGKEHSEFPAAASALAAPSNQIQKVIA